MRRESLPIIYQSTSETATQVMAAHAYAAGCIANAMSDEVIVCSASYPVSRGVCTSSDMSSTHHGDSACLPDARDSRCPRYRVQQGDVFLTQAAPGRRRWSACDAGCEDDWHAPDAQSRMDAVPYTWDPHAAAQRSATHAVAPREHTANVQPACSGMCPSLRLLQTAARRVLAPMPGTIHVWSPCSSLPEAQCGSVAACDGCERELRLLRPR